jgi:hypothetical protein
MSDIFFRQLGMPEEINRELTDAISDLLFVAEESTRGPAPGSSRSAFPGLRILVHLDELVAGDTGLRADRPQGRPFDP